MWVAGGESSRVPNQARTDVVEQMELNIALQVMLSKCSASTWLLTHFVFAPYLTVAGVTSVNKQHFAEWQLLATMAENAELKFSRSKGPRSYSNVSV